MLKIYDYGGKKNLCGERIHQIRTTKRISQDDLAAKMQVRGVMILCEGAENPVVEQRVTEAVKTVLGIPASRICVEKISN